MNLLRQLLLVTLGVTAAIGSLQAQSSSTTVFVASGGVMGITGATSVAPADTAKTATTSQGQDDMVIEQHSDTTFIFTGKRRENVDTLLTSQDTTIVRTVKSGDAADNSSSSSVSVITRNHDGYRIRSNGKIYRIDSKGNATIVRKGKYKRSNPFEILNGDEVDEIADKVGHFFSERDFRGHWAGMQLGFSWLLSSQGSLYPMGAEDAYRLKLGSSISFAINPFQYSISIVDRRFGVVTGIGFNFNFYRFQGGTTLGMNRDGVFVDSTLLQGGAKVASSKLRTGYFTVPLLLELQSPRRGYWKRFYIAAGVIGGVKMYATTKVRYNGNRELYHSNAFFINDVQFATTVRIGLGPMHLYANYYPMGLFEQGRGPTFYPIEFGMLLFSF